MSISTERIRADIAAIARFTETPGAAQPVRRFLIRGGGARLRHRRRRNSRAAPCRIDAFGNVHARPSTLSWETPAWLCGSHIDTVPHGGDYDGVAGIVVALEILRADPFGARRVDHLRRRRRPDVRPGNARQPRMGRRTDRRATRQISATNRARIISKPAHRTASIRHTSHRDRINPAHYRGLIEVHIEQGPGMWKNDQPSRSCARSPGESNIVARCAASRITPVRRR